MPCPTCSRPAEPRPANGAFPFCSARCKLVDLGRWLNEEYRVPVPGSSGSLDDDHLTSQEQE